MARISITEAATAGFAVARRKPTALIAWAGVGLAVLVATLPVFFLLAGDQLQTIAATLQSGAVKDSDELLALYRPLFPAYGAAFLISLIGYSILMPAIYRAVLQPEVSSPGYLKFGLAEVRQFALLVVMAVLFFVIDGGLGWLLRLVAGTGQAALAVNAIGSLVALCLLIFVFVRLSLAGPDTLARSRLSLAGSWKLSKGAFWPMFGAYALSVLLQIMIAAGLVIVMGVVVGVASVGMKLGPVGSVLILLVGVLYFVAVCMIYALSLAVMAAPAATIYRELTAAEAPAA